MLCSLFSPRIDVCHSTASISHHSFKRILSMLGILRRLYVNPAATRRNPCEQLAKQSGRTKLKLFEKSSGCRVSVFAFFRTSWCLTKIRTTSSSHGGGIPSDVTVTLLLLLWKCEWKEKKTNKQSASKNDTFTASVRESQSCFPLTDKSGRELVPAD